MPARLKAVEMFFASYLEVEEHTTGQVQILKKHILSSKVKYEHCSSPLLLDESIKLQRHLRSMVNSAMKLGLPRCQHQCLIRRVLAPVYHTP